MTCQGSLRLRGPEEYASILQLLTDAAETKPPTLTLDLRALRFLNSSRINVLAKLVLYVRTPGKPDRMRRVSGLQLELE